jgi:hypothetical protein
MSTQHFKPSLKHKLSFIGVSTALILLSGCSTDDGDSNSRKAVAIDVTIPSVLQKNTTTTVPISLAYTSSMPVGEDSNDSRTVTISDTSSCSPKLTINPGALNIIVGAPATSFDLTTPAVACAHVVQIDVSGSTSSVTTGTVTVLDNAVVSVGLFTPAGVATTTVIQGNSVKLRFTSPSDWEGVIADQIYAVSTGPSGVTFTGSPCSLTPDVTTSCEVTAAVAGSVTPASYSFSITKESGTVVNPDITSLNYTVTNPALISGTISLPRTGQTSTDPIVAPLSSGADGSLEEGVAWNVPRFSSGATSGSTTLCVTSGGVVNDSLTSLMWTNDADLPSSGAITWDESLTYANALTLCGYDDWRLPNRNELSSLINYAVSSQSTWLANSGGFTNVQSANYWSSSTYAPNTDGAWSVFFSDGGVNGSNKSSFVRVWPVRGSSE